MLVAIFKPLRPPLAIALPLIECTSGRTRSASSCGATPGSAGDTLLKKPGPALTGAACCRGRSRTLSRCCFSSQHGGIIAGCSPRSLHGPQAESQREGSGPACLVRFEQPYLYSSILQTIFLQHARSAIVKHQLTPHLWRGRCFYCDRIFGDETSLLIHQKVRMQGQCPGTLHRARRSHT